MAQIYGTIGSLSCLSSKLKGEKIAFLNSLDDIISFRDNFENQLSNIKEATRKALLLEKEELKQKLTALSGEYDIKIKEHKNVLTNEKNSIERLINQYSVNAGDIFSNLYYAYKRHSLHSRKSRLSTHFEDEARRPFINIENNLSLMKQRLHRMETQVDTILEARIKPESSLLHAAKFIIDNDEAALLGAIGEQKALNELKKLPDSYVVINDFQYEFGRALHKKNTNEWIKSIQADHLVIGPSGVFVIETKNWSSHSIRSLDLYSPVQQIERTNYAIFFLLNQAVSHGLLSSFNHHWGSRKISVNSIILMVNKKPNQEFQHVRILTLNNVCRYIQYRKPELTTDEIRQLTSTLVREY